MSVATKVIEVVHDKDPKLVITDALKAWLPRIRSATGADYLICVYERPEKMTNGLIMPQNASRLVEDKFQGNVGLIVAKGPNVEEYKSFFRNGAMPQVGDWVAFRTQEAVAFTLGDRAMRLVQANMIRLVLEDPDCII